MPQLQPAGLGSDPGIVCGLAVLTVAGAVFAQTDFFVANIPRGSAICGLLAGPLLLLSRGLLDQIGKRRAARQQVTSRLHRAAIG